MVMMMGWYAVYKSMNFQSKIMNINVKYIRYGIVNKTDNQLIAAYRHIILLEIG